MASTMYAVHTTFRMIDKFSQPMSKLTASTQKFNGTLNQVSANINQIHKYVNDVASKFTLAFATVGLVTTAVLKQSAIVESAIVSMTGKLGGMRHKAISMVKDLETFAVNNPLTIEPVITGANILMAQGVAQSDLMKTIEQLGNLAQGSDEAFESMTRGYARIFAEDRITREHLDRFTTHGLGMYEALAKTLNMTQTELSKEMERGNIGRDALIQAVENMTGENGMYYRSMEKHMNTLSGATQQFKGTGSVAMRAIGDTFSAFTMKSLQGGTGYLKGLTDVFDEINKKRYKYNGKEYEDLGEAQEAWRNDKHPFQKTNFIEELNTEAFTNIWNALQKIKKAFEGLLPDTSQIIARLEDGSSWFFYFCDVIVAVINTLKAIKWVLEKIIPVIMFITRPFLNLSGVLVTFGLIIAPIIAKVISFSQAFLQFAQFISPALLTRLKIAFANFALNIMIFFTERLPLAFKSFGSRIGSFFARTIPNLFKRLSSRIGGIFAKTAVFKGLLAILGKALGLVGLIQMATEFLYRNVTIYKQYIDGLISGISRAAEWLLSTNNPIFKAWSSLFENIAFFIFAFANGSLKMLLLVIVRMIVDGILFIPKLVSEGLAMMFEEFGAPQWLTDKVRGLNDALNKPSEALRNIITDEMNKIKTSYQSLKEATTAGVESEVENNVAANLTAQAKIIINNSERIESEVDIDGRTYNNTNATAFFNPLGDPRFS